VLRSRSVSVGVAILKELGSVFKPLKPQAQSAGYANRHSAWGYTSKACLPRLKAIIFVVRAGGESSAAGGFPDPGNWRWCTLWGGDTRRNLVPVAAPWAGDGEARKQVITI